MAVVVQVYEPVADPGLFDEAMAAIGAQAVGGGDDNSSWIVRHDTLTLDDVRAYVLKHAYGDPEFAVFEAPVSAGGTPSPLSASTPRRGTPPHPLKSRPSLPSREGTKDQIA